MNKIFTAILLMINFYTYSENWENHWIKGLEEAKKENSALAEEQLSLAIKLVEEKSDFTHPYLYIARGNAYIQQKKYMEALSDFNKALAFKELILNDQLKSLMGRMSAYYSLGENDKAEADCTEVKKLSGGTVQMMTFEDKMIIRNLPEDAFFRSVIAESLVAYKMCQSKSDIQIIDSDTWVIPKAQ
ncbi:MAG TPA: tetratricopeptide repeat protein [Parachlamydiaceae bacterium]|nr:tetratricopeptide repeat protein [Parachlamydiaceae bacterium]